MRLTWRTLAILTALAVLGNACGGSENAADTSTTLPSDESLPSDEQLPPDDTLPADDTLPPDDTLPADETVPTDETLPPDESPTTSTTTATTTTTEPPPEDPPAIANPDRPWVKEARDELVARSGIALAAANCVFELTESEGFDARHLLWDDDWTPQVIQIAVGACGSFIDGPFELPSSDTPPDGYGDNAELDLYWDWCEAGDGVACDVLWFESPSDSAYEAYGETCGQRSDNATCPNLLGTDAPGESPFLDRALQSCRDGYSSSCWDLEFHTESGEYHRLGQTCGDRVPAAVEPDCVAAIAADG